MGTKSKGKRRSVDFSGGMKMLSEMSDQKVLEYTKNFTGALSALKVRLDVVEDLLKEKFGETEQSLNERAMLVVEKNQGFVESDNDVLQGSVLRLKAKEEIVGQETPTTRWEDAYIVVGRGQVHPSVDALVIGAKLGETRDVIVDDPKDSTKKYRLTIQVMKIFKGEEATSEAQAEQTTQNQAAAQS